MRHMKQRIWIGVLMALLPTPLFAQQAVTISTEAPTVFAVTTTKPTGTAELGGVGEPSTKISGKVFADVTRKSNLDLGQTEYKRRAGGNGTGVDVSRFYIGVSHNANAQWGAVFVSDIGDQVGKYNIFVKNAYIEYRIIPEATVRLGAAALGWIGYVENVFGYRYVEQVLIDRTKFGSSTDWGVHFLGKTAGGIVNYQLAAVNGGGYPKPARPKSQDFDLDGRIGLDVGGTYFLALGGYRGNLGNNVPTLHTAERINGLAAYKSTRFRLGAEGFVAYNWRTVTSTKTDKSLGWSSWLSYNFWGDATCFTRYDQLKPSMELNPGLLDQYILAGLDYKIGKSVNIATAYKHEKVRAGSMQQGKKVVGGKIATGNGTIGSSKPNQYGRYSEVGLYAQYSF